MDLFKLRCLQNVLLISFSKTKNHVMRKKYIEQSVNNTIQIFNKTSSYKHLGWFTHLYVYKLPAISVDKLQNQIVYLHRVVWWGFNNGKMFCDAFTYFAKETLSFDLFIFRLIFQFRNCRYNNREFDFIHKYLEAMEDILRTITASIFNNTFLVEITEVLFPTSVIFPFKFQY